MIGGGRPEDRNLRRRDLHDLSAFDNLLGMPLHQEAGQRHDADGRRRQQEAGQNLAHGREDSHIRVEAGEQDVERRHQDDDEQGVEELELVRSDRQGDERHPQVHVIAREGDPKRVVVFVPEPEEHDQGENREEPP